MAKATRQYIQIVTFRVVLAVLALLTAAVAGHQLRSDGPVWLVASILAAGASACLIWPLVVPSKNRTMAVYSIGPAFFLAGMFLLPPGMLVLSIAFAVALAGMVHGARAYRTVFHLSASILAFGGFALAFRLGPRPSDFMFQPAPRAGLELLIAAAAIVTLLLIRSVALRLEHGDDAPHWGAFQSSAVVEAVLCVVFSITITVLARINLALLVAVYVEIGAIWWFLHRYHAFASKKPARHPSTRTRRTDRLAIERGEMQEKLWGEGRARKIR